jgi:colicin import membrane protein
VAARIKPNVVFTDVAPGNPRAEVEVRTAPDGTITSRKLNKSSGNAAWDEAVLRAIDRTISLPKDTDGRVPPSLVIGLRPLD